MTVIRTVAVPTSNSVGHMNRAKIVVTGSP